MAVGAEVHVTVTEFPNHASHVAFAPFHLPDFKKRCVMLCLEKE